jgi:hypothetical protein
MGMFAATLALSKLILHSAPAVVSERLPSGTEAIDAIDGVLPYFGINKPGAVIAVSLAELCHDLITDDGCRTRLVV